MAEPQIALNGPGVAVLVTFRPQRVALAADVSPALAPTHAPNVLSQGMLSGSRLLYTHTCRTAEPLGTSADSQARLEEAEGVDQAGPL